MRTAQLLLVVVIVFLFGSLASCRSQTDGGNLQLDDESYQVYSAALMEFFDNTKPGVVRQVSDRTQTHQIFDRTESQSSPVELEPRFNVSFQYELVDAAQLQADFEKLEPQQFTQKYPHFSGLIWLSPVHFQDKHNEASVTVTFTMCPLCEFGTTVGLQKGAAGWKVISREGEWKS
jgi:hypothetical protein